MPASAPVSGDDGRTHSVRIYTLGRFHVDLDDGALPFTARAHRKPLELLKVLIAQGGEQVAEDLLSEALWPDADGDQAHGSFASTLLRLRRLIGQDALLLRDRRLTLDTTRCWVDAHAFEAALEGASRSAATADVQGAWEHLEQALALYRGPFLEGEFEPPQILPARERLHGAFLRHIKSLGAQLQAAGETQRAMLLYQRGLESDPLAEELYLALMRTHLELGQAAEGIAVYRRCHDLLEAGAGIQPSPEVERLYAALLAGRQEAGARPPTEVASPAAQPSAGSPVPAQAPTVPRRNPWMRRGTLAALAMLALALAAGALLVWFGVRSPSSGDGSAAAALTPPDEPSIVVLPFENYTGDASQDYFANGLSDSLTTQLYKVPDLFVIARQSATVYQGRKVGVQRIGRELGVRYVLEGSVQRSARRLRINAQLIEAATGRHIWAEQYDRELNDVFAAQDAIVRRIATELGVRLSKGEMLRAAVAATTSYRAFDLYVQADQLYARQEKESNARARELLEQALAEDPQYARAAAFLGWTHLVDFLFRWSADAPASLRLAEDWAERALTLDESVYLGHTLLGRILMIAGRHEDAVAESARALVSEPGNAVGMFSHSMQLVLAGRPQEALPLIDRALRLAPYPPVYFHIASGLARGLTGRHEEAVTAFRAYLERQARGPNARRSRAWLIVSLMELGREEEARAAVAELLEAEPAVTLDALLTLERRAPFKDRSYLERHARLLRQAGVPQ